MQDINITPEKVFMPCYLNLDPHKASGPDNIPGSMLNKTAYNYEITPKSTHLFQQSLITGDIGGQHRLPLINYKKGQRTDPQN